MALINAQSRHLYYYYSTKFRSGVESATPNTCILLYCSSSCGSFEDAAGTTESRSEG